MNHAHDFHITLREVLADGTYAITKECACGESWVENSKTGEWIKL